MEPDSKPRQSDTGTKNPAQCLQQTLEKKILLIIILTSFGPIGCANLYDHQQSSSLILGPY